MTIVCTTNEGLYAKCSAISCIDQSSDNGLLIIKFEHLDRSGNKQSFMSNLVHEILVDQAHKGGFFSYIAGTAAAIISDDKCFNKIEKLKIDKSIHGVYIDNYLTTLPMKKGLSSSAAICTLVVQSFNSIYSLELSIEEIMDLSYRGEMLTPSKCGRMDQCVAIGIFTLYYVLFGQ